MFKTDENLAKPANLFLRLPLSEKQLVILCDSSEDAAGCVLLTEDYMDTAEGSLKTYAPIAFGSNSFTTGQMLNTMYATEFLAKHFAFSYFGQILWSVKKPLIMRL